MNFWLKVAIMVTALILLMWFAIKTAPDRRPNQAKKPTPAAVPKPKPKPPVVAPRPRPKAGDYFPSDTEAQVAVKHWMRNNARKPGTVSYRNWRSRGTNIDGIRALAVRVEANGENAFGGMTGWLDKEFVVACKQQYHCVAVHVTYGDGWNRY